MRKISVLLAAGAATTLTIHPVYAIDVCTKKTMSACRVNVATDWRPLQEFLQDE